MYIYRSFVFALNMTRLVIGPLHDNGVPRTPGNGRCRPESCAFRDISKFAQRSPQV